MNRCYLLSFVTLLLSTFTINAQRVKYNFNPGWKIFVGDPADAQGPGNYILSKDLPVACGVNRVLIRTTTQAGTIMLQASTEGLKPASLELHSQPFAVVNGLAEELPADGLLPFLDRGPTPSTPSFVTTRKAIAIIAARAGANSSDACKSFDDNELSDWVNDGQLSTAWIEYTLAKEATVAEVVLKLNNFRTRRYPIRITLEGKTIFSGSTARSLGYFTAHCTSARGKKLRIELMGNGITAAESGTELSGKKLDDGVARDDLHATGTLSIIEAEVYEQSDAK